MLSVQSNTTGVVNSSQSEEMNMSIRLMSGGLAFALWSSREEAEPLTQGFIPIGTGYGSWSEAMQDVFFQNEFLCFPYHSVSAYYQPEQIVLIPREHYEAEELGLWLQAVSPLSAGEEPQWGALAYPLEDEGKLQGLAWSQSMYQFLQRTHLRLRMIPEYMPWLALRKRLSRQSTQAELCVSLHPEGIDCFLVKQGEVQFANQYRFVRPSDEHDAIGEMNYYILALWRSLELRGQIDSLALCYSLDEGESNSPRLLDLLEGLREQLLPYIPQVTIHTRSIVRDNAHQL
ncbi:MAG: DUF3822 family protein [Porphyromonadaceae bacterium]|nr:DUF3822 family protein [Porphyromonadaceae bacterium]